MSWLAVAAALLVVTFARPFAIGGIRVYRALAPARVRAGCRFHPSCSHYAEAAIAKYGVPKAVVMTASRLKRCTPPHGGEDWP